MKKFIIALVSFSCFGQEGPVNLKKLAMEKLCDTIESQSIHERKVFFNNWKTSQTPLDIESGEHKTTKRQCETIKDYFEKTRGWRGIKPIYVHKERAVFGHALITPNNTTSVVQKHDALYLLDHNKGEHFATLKVNLEYPPSTNQNPYFISAEQLISGYVTSIIITPDSKKIISGSADNTIKIWDSFTGQLLYLLNEKNKKYSGITALATTHDSALTVSNTSDLNLQLWNNESGHDLGTFANNKHTSSISSIMVTKDNKAISASWDRSVIAWDIATQKAILQRIEHLGLIKKLAISSDDNILLSASADNTIKMWDVQQGNCIDTLKGHSSWVSDVIITSDNNKAISWSEDETVRVWDLNMRQTIFTFKAHDGTKHATELFKATIALTDDQTKIAFISNDETFNVYDINHGICMKKIKLSFNPRSLAINKKNILIAGDNNIELFKTADWDEIEGKPSTPAYLQAHKAINALVGIG